MEGYATTQQVSNDMFTAYRIPDTFQWAEGTIGAEVDQSDEAQAALARLVLDSIVQVPRGEENGANCTDGRVPDLLESGDLVPVRPTLSGASLVAAHSALEAVDLLPITRLPEETVWWTAETMQRANLVPIAHKGCAAGAAHLTLKENTIRFAGNPDFQNRQRQTMKVNSVPYDERVQDRIIGNHRRQLRRAERYTDLNLDTFLDVARQTSGGQGVASYVDNGRGVNGHVEGAVMRLYTPGYAVDTRTLNFDGGQAFTVNDDMAANMAKRLAFAVRRLDMEIPLRHALNTYANVVHGTLVVPDTPTWLVRKRNGTR